MTINNENKTIGLKELTIYDNLIKQYIHFSKKNYATNSQIDELFENGDEPASIEIKSFSTSTDEEIASVINGYYNGDITLEEIKEVWSVGDTRDMDISAITTSGGLGATAWNVGESHRAQIVTIQILDFDHDNLATAINGKTKALITCDLKNCLRDATVTDTTGYQNTEHGYMHNSNMAVWSVSDRRAWCNNAFYSALPLYIKDLVKEVIKITGIPSGWTSTYGSSPESTNDKVFLLSEIEVFGNVNYSLNGEGSQYALYDTAIPRYKLPKYGADSYIKTDIYFMRSPETQGENYCLVDENGGAMHWQASSTMGIAPAFCM